MEDKYKAKIKKYNYSRTWGRKVDPATSDKAKMSPGDIAFSKIAYKQYGNTSNKRKFKYLILAIVKTESRYIAYLTKRSHDKRMPTLSSNHQYSVEEIETFEKFVNLSLKSKLKDL